MEQGSFANLRSGGGYVESLDISSHFSDDEEEKPSLGPGYDTETKNSKPSTTKSDEDQTLPSDSSVFLYYCKAMRAHNVAMQVLFTVSSGVIGTFRCEFLVQVEHIDF